MTKLFIGGVPYSMQNQQLQDLFTPFGEVLSASIAFDKFTNQSKGFAFVEMANDNEALEAIKQLDGTDLEGRKIGVSVARPREDSPRRDFNGGSRDGGNRDRNSFSRNGSGGGRDGNRGGSRGGFRR